jgi:hypothetical protein
VEKDIQYYNEILKKAKIMESIDPILCKSILLKCIQYIDKESDKFVKAYPDRLDEMKIITKKIAYLSKRFGNKLIEEEKNFFSGSTFVSFINEAIERAKLFSSRFEYRKAAIILNEAKKMASDYDLAEQCDLIETLEKLYQDENAVFIKKNETIKTLIEEVKKLDDANVLPPIIVACNTIVTLARETGQPELVKKYSDKKDQIQINISEHSKTLPNLIQKLNEFELSGGLKNAKTMGEKIIEIAHQLGKTQIKTQYIAHQDTIQNKIDMEGLDLQTQLSRFTDKLKKDKELSLLDEALEDITQITSILTKLDKTQDLNDYQKQKENLFN